MSKTPRYGIIPLPLSLSGQLHKLLPKLPMALLLAPILTLLLAGCGQRGPLYLPDETAPASAPAGALPPEDALETELEEEDDLEGGNLQHDSFEDEPADEGGDAP